MLDNLKKCIANEQRMKFVTEAASLSDDDTDIKDAFLDDFDLQVTGAENDPEIAKLCDSIPEYDDDNQDINDDLQSMTENFIPESIIP